MGVGCTALPICDLGAIRAGWPMPHPSFFMPRKEIQYPMCGRLGGPRHPKNIESRIQIMKISLYNFVQFPVTLCC